MISSGTTAKATTDDTAITLLTIDRQIRRVTIINEGTEAGFFSVDSGATWGRLPAGPSSITVEVPEAPKTGGTVQAKRVASGSNLADVWAFAT